MTTGKSRSGFPGAAVPNEGECEIAQTSSGTDVLTLTLASGVTSTTGGRALVVGRNRGDGALSSAEVFAVHYDGIQEWRHVVAISTASTGYVPAASQSGALFVIGDCTAAPLTITLPAAQSGLWYEFYQAGSVAASGTKVASATAGMMVAFADSSVSAVQIGATGTAVGGSLRVVSDGTKWYCITQPAMSSLALSTTAMTCFNRTT